MANQSTKNQDCTKFKIGALTLFIFLQFYGFSQNLGFENSFIQWTSNTAPWSITTTAGELRSGARSARLATSSTTDVLNRNTGTSVTTPASGTNYVTVIAWVRNGATGGADSEVAVGAFDGSVSNKGAVVVSPGVTFTRISHTFLATNGATYTPEIIGRSTNGTAVQLFFDDVVIYTSTQSSADFTAPTQSRAIAVTNSGSSITLNWTIGTDLESGVDGVLIVRANGLQPTIGQPLDQTMYNSSTLVGPALVGTHSVRTNATNTSTFTESVSNNTIYTYVIYTRDKAFNYSPFARIFVFNGTGLNSPALVNNSAIDGLFLPATNTFNIGSSSTVTLRNSVIQVGGTVNVQGNFNNSASTLSFLNGSVYNFNRNNPGGFALVTANWLPGSTCRVNGITTGLPGGTGQTFANFEWNSTGQTNALVLSNLFNATGNVTINSTGTSSLSFNASGINQIGGNLIQNGGNLLFANGNTIVLNGSSTQSIFVNGPFSNLTLNNTTGINLNNPVTLNNTLTLSNGVFNISSHLLQFQNGAHIIRNLGSLNAMPSFLGDIDVTYLAGVTTGPELPSSSTALRNLTINTTGVVSLNQSATANNLVNFVQGHLQLNAFDLTIGSNSIITGTNENRYVITNGSGFLRQLNLGTSGRSGSIVFPIGSSISNYTPASITNNNSSDSFEARVFDNVYDGYDAAATPTGSMILSDFVDKTWVIFPAGSGNNIDLSLQWNGSDELTGFDRTIAAVTWFDGSSWVDQASGASSGTNPYMVTASGLSDLGIFSVEEVQSSLPVELVGFGGQRNDLSVTLQWHTISEVDNDYFEIQRAVAEGEFEAIGQVNGQGTTINKTTYDYEDVFPSRETAYYRLKQVDFDGDFEFSPVIAIEGISLPKEDIFTVIEYKNDLLKLRLNSEKQTSLIISNIEGKVIQQLATNEKETLEIPLSESVIIISAQTEGSFKKQKVMMN
ncbi:MAG: beta strand repeat-containing protein [Fluviicola sp.]